MPAIRHGIIMINAIVSMYKNTFARIEMILNSTFWSEACLKLVGSDAKICAKSGKVKERIHDPTNATVGPTMSNTGFDNNLWRLIGGTVDGLSCAFRFGLLSVI